MENKTIRIEPGFSNWAADNQYSIINKLNGNWIMFQEVKGADGYFEYGFNGTNYVSFKVRKDEAPKFYEETKTHVNRVLKKYEMDEIK